MRFLEGLILSVLLSSTIQSCTHVEKDQVARNAGDRSLDGEWELVCKSNRGLRYGTFTLHQAGNKITGKGSDDNDFAIDGTVDFSKSPVGIQFSKQILVDNQPKGPPMLHLGELVFPREGPYASGVYISQEKEGSAPDAKLVEKRNMWEAAWSHAVGGGSPAQGFRDSGHIPLR